jgi:hypothetical protein
MDGMYNSIEVSGNKWQQCINASTGSRAVGVFNVEVEIMLMGMIV